MIEKYENSISTGWELTIPVWRTRRHQWDFRIQFDRVHSHRTGNYLLRFEFGRWTSPTWDGGKFHSLKQERKRA